MAISEDVLDLRPTEAARRRTTRVAIAQFSSLAAAEKSAARVVRGGVPENSVRVVAADVRWVKASDDQRDFWAVAMETLRDGAAFGALFGGLWSAAGLGGDTATMVPSVLLGALLGALTGFAIGAFVRWGQQDPVLGSLDADCFDLLVDEVFERPARAALGNRDRTSGRFSRS